MGRRGLKPIARCFADHLVADTYAGYLCLDGEVVTAEGAPKVRATLTTHGFHRMLYRHPARRLHPLRRR